MAQLPLQIATAGVASLVAVCDRCSCGVFHKNLGTSKRFNKKNLLKGGLNIWLGPIQVLFLETMLVICLYNYNVESRTYG